MFRRQVLTAAFAAAALMLGSAAQAAEQRPFDRAAFEAAQAAGRPILVDVYADWCPTCRAQAPAIAGAVQGAQYRQLVVFKLNFDKQKADWRQMRVQRQSTLIAFNGHRETGRVVGETDPAAIAQLIATTLR